MGKIKKAAPIAAWNNWYHVTVHVYGSWLGGDPRGWRARHHREHVDGDYKNPPPKGEEGGLWAKRCHAEPIADRSHQLRVFGYILGHLKKGGRVWRFDRQPT